MLDNGARSIEVLRSLLRVFTYPPNATSVCPLCEEEEINQDSLLSHILNSHTNCSLRGEKLPEQVVDKYSLARMKQDFQTEYGVNGKTDSG